MPFVVKSCTEALAKHQQAEKLNIDPRRRLALQI
jgi:hypothetical protein